MPFLKAPRAARHRRGRRLLRAQAGQATVEWVGLVTLAALVLGALAAVVPHVDGRSYGGFLTHRIVCAVKGGCDDGDAALARAYGARDAALVRQMAPGLVYERGEAQLPVDWRRCREVPCAEAEVDADLDVHRTTAGERATVFTRVIRQGGRTFVSYWFYYPDSNSTWMGTDRAWEKSWLLPRVRELIDGSSDYPGWHADDWESAHVRIDPDGTSWMRVSSHGGYETCKDLCDEEWMRSTGWTRVSRGSHAGHIPATPGGRRPLYPGADAQERTTTPEGLRLVPLETIDRSAYRPLDDAIKPPWRKEVYRRPGSDES